jgi:hypothetical protein
MSIDDFFKNVDSNLEAMHRSASAAQSAAEKNMAFARQLIERLTPIARAYEDQLKERRIRVKLSASEDGIFFRLEYKNGHHYALALNTEGKLNRLEIKSHFTNEGGKNYVSTTGATYDENNWNDSVYTEQLEKCIQDFLFYANRHGGV